MEAVLNPNCSEIVCRLDGEELEVCTWDHSKELLDFLLKKRKPIRKAKLLFRMGEGDWKYIKRVLKMHRHFAEGRITGEQLEEIVKFTWMHRRLPDFLVVDGRLHLEPTPEKIYCLLTGNPKEVFCRFRDERRREIMKVYRRYRGNRAEMKAKLLALVL
ncbi:MAG: hypothetical protein QW356_02050 [Candidatus Hadarchaeales archaeon]